MKEYRPKIRIELDLIDKIIEGASLLFIIAIWAITLLEIRDLPDIIPIHFDIVGKADNFGNKYTILFLPIISTLLFILITVLNKFPHTFNYLTKITLENAEKQYKISTKMMRFIKLSVTFIFTFLNYSVILSAKSHVNSVGIWFLPIVLALIFIPLIYGIRSSIKS